MASFIFYTSSKSGRSLCPTLYNNIALSYGLLINWLLLKLPKLLFERVNRKSRADPNGSTVARLLGLRVRIPPGAWLSVSCGCCLLSCREVSVLGWSLVRRSPTECGVCDHEASIMRPGPLGAPAAWRKKNEISRIWRNEEKQMNGTHLPRTRFTIQRHSDQYETQWRWPGISCTYTDMRSYQSSESVTVLTQSHTVF